MIPASVPEDCTTAVIRISGENMKTQTRKIVTKKSPEKTFGKILNGNASEDHLGSGSTPPRSDSSDYGSLKRRKTLRSASLGSLLQNQEENATSNVTSVTSNVAKTQNSNPANPLIGLRSFESGPITFTSSVKVQYKTILPIAGNSLQVKTNKTSLRKRCKKKFKIQLLVRISIFFT